ncbi:MAG TPA: hypothetical protein VFP54_07380 [Acidimicrobiales bacterium]|nr:hypothetical protein [Acidimicrobiales bacterium]
MNVEDDRFWGTPDKAEPTRFRPPEDATALLESLGPPPLPGGLAALAAVYAEASRMASALGRAAGLVVADDD